MITEHSGTNPSLASLWGQGADIEQRILVYPKNGGALVGTFGLDKQVTVKTARHIFKDDKFSVGGAVAGELDLEFYPVNSFDAQDIPKNPAFAQDLQDGTLTDLTATGGVLALEDD